MLRAQVSATPEREWFIAVFPFSTSWRIVLEVRIAGTAVPQTKHIPRQLDCVAARTDLAVQLHCKAWPITAYYWLNTWYAPRILHFCALNFANDVWLSFHCSQYIQIL